MTPTLVESERADVVNQACHALATTILLAFSMFVFFIYVVLLLAHQSTFAST